MTQKIKLMSEQEKEYCIDRYFDSNDMEIITTGDLVDTVADECEKRATERLKEVAFEAWEAGGDNSSGFEWGTGTVKSFDNWFQQFLKEQDGKE